jgi:hypothetical protein
VQKLGSFVQTLAHNTCTESVQPMVQAHSIFCPTRSSGSAYLRSHAGPQGDNAILQCKQTCQGNHRCCDSLAFGAPYMIMSYTHTRFYTSSDVAYKSNIAIMEATAWSTSTLIVHKSAIQEATSQLPSSLLNP